MKVKIDPDLCTGHGRCYDIAPSVFHEDERGHGYVDRPEVGEQSREKVRRAAANCPEQAITLEDD